MPMRLAFLPAHLNRPGGSSLRDERNAECRREKGIAFCMNSRISNPERLALRWTIGDVRDRGFEMLRLSIACAFQLFGSSAKYVVCVNSLAAETARERTGDLPVAVEWLETTRNDVPAVLRSYL